jgi:hypothetical protein
MIARALGAVTGALLLVGCAQLEYPNSGAAPAAQVSPPSTFNADPSPPETRYQPPVLEPDPAPDDPAPQLDRQPDTGPSFTHDATVAGLTVAGMEAGKHLFRNRGTGAAGSTASAEPDAAPRIGVGEADGAATVATNGGEAAGAGAGTSGGEAAGAAGAAGTAMEAAGATELEEWGAAVGRGMLWLGEECILVFCR